MYYKAVHGTAVIFLQNAAGFAKWEPTAERIQELLAAYRVSGRALPSPGTSSSTPTPTSTTSSSTPTSAGGGGEGGVGDGAGDKDCKAAPERSASLDTSGSQDCGSPGDKATPDAAAAASV